MPNQPSISAPRCQITNFSISFSNIKWSTFGENPEYCFGTITTYEYQLPNGWSIGANVSNGTNWIQGGNSVTVTSDLSTGNGDVIRIRPTNNCGAGLANGQTPAQIGISRPEPNLQIQGSQFYICTGTANFNLTNLPSGASVLWSLSNTTDASIVGANNQSTVTIQRSTSTNTIVTLTATVTHCSFTYTRSRDIPLGTGVADFTFSSLYTTITNMNGYTQPYLYGAVNDVPHMYYYNWYYKINSGGPGGGGGQFVWAKTAYYPSTDFALPKCDSFYTIKVQAATPCGTLTTPLAEGVIHASCDNNFRMSVSPNPAKDILNIKLDDEDMTIEQFEIWNKMGLIIQKGKANNLRTLQLNISSLKSDIYVIRIYNGKLWSSTRFIKEN